jgi:hypothetical protein
MELGGPAELVTLRTQVQAARLDEEVKHACLWCLDQLPQLYADFCATCESRFVDAILWLARAVLKRLDEKGSGEDSRRVAETLVAQLRSLHERLGLAPLVLRPASSGRGRARKAG